MNDPKSKTLKPAKKSAAVKPADSKERLLAVATKQFAERGFEGVVIRDIARAAGVTLPTIYHFFGDKRKLYEQTCIEVFSKKHAALSEALASSADPAARLWRFTLALVGMLTDDVDFSRLLQRELVEQDYYIIGQTVRLSLQPHFEMLVATVGDLTSQHEKLDRSVAIYSMVFGLACLRPVWQELGPKRIAVQKDAAQESLAVLSLVFPEVAWKSFIGHDMAAAIA